jgi:hypothetical protein
MMFPVTNPEAMASWRASAIPQQTISRQEHNKQHTPTSLPQASRQHHERSVKTPEKT